MENPRILGSNFPQFSQCRYYVGGYQTTVFFLRHPQGASGDVMRRAVKYILDMPNPNGH